MKRAFTSHEVLIVVAILAITVAFLGPLLRRIRSDSPRTSHCSSNLRQLGLAFLQYAEDNGNKFPPARKTASTGWAVAIFPYVKDVQTYQCDQAIKGSTRTLTTDYFYNAHLSRMVSNKIKNPSFTLLGGDGDDNAPTWNSLVWLSSDAVTDFSSVGQRHQGGALYLFADGHVKYIKPEDLASSTKWNPLAP